MKKNILLIVNPKAGKGTIEKKLPKILDNFYKQGYAVDIHHTRPDYKPRDIIEKQKCKTIDFIICCGGDGTLNELINAVMELEKKPYISFIPLGTMNDFAKTIKMSTNRFFLSKNINESKKIATDIGKFNKTYFNYVAAFGAFTPVPYVTKQILKKTMGRLAYFVVAFKYIPKIKSVRMTLEVDGNKINDEFVFGSISNSKLIGNIDWFKKGTVKVNDGKFEMMFVKKPKNIFEFIDMSCAIILKQYHRKYFNYFQSNEITIKSKTNLAWTLDGEYGGRTREVKIKNNQKQLIYIVPQ